MALSGREVTEWVGPDMRLWCIAGPGRLWGLGLAARSPLTGHWLVTVAGEDLDGWGQQSWRVPTLREARRSVLAGNGRQRGGHCEVTRVRPEPTRGAIKRMLAA